MNIYQLVRQILRILATREAIEALIELLRRVLDKKYPKRH
jgi:hypothetical protein